MRVLLFDALSSITARIYSHKGQNRDHCTTGTTLTFNQCNIFGSNSKNIKSVATNTATTELDPQYTNAAQGDFTVGNATVKSAGQGDPRWLK